MAEKSKHDSNTLTSFIIFSQLDVSIFWNKKCPHWHKYEILGTEVRNYLDISAPTT